MDQYNMDELTCMIACESAVSKGMLANDKFMITVVEHCDDPNFKVIYEMSLEEVRNAFITAIQNILDALAEFARKVSVAMASAIESKKLNEKLAEVKSILAKNRAKFMNKKISMFDIVKYNKYYTEYINKYTKQVKDMASRKFNSVEEYNNWKEKMQNQLAEFNLKLTDEEQWKLSASINQAVQMTENEVKNYKANIKMAHACGDKTIADMKGQFKYEERQTDSQVNSDDKAGALIRMTNNMILTFCNQISAIIRSAINMIRKHPFATLALVVVAIAI